PFTDDPVSEIRLPSGNASVDRLCERVAGAGLRLRLIAMCEGAFPAGMLASIYDENADPPMVHAGCGCSWSPVHAAVRAITEAAQSRIADIQGARENILRPGDPVSRFTGHTRRRRVPPYGRWYFDGPANPLELAALPDRSSDDL